MTASLADLGRVDLAVVGGGPAGSAAAVRALAVAPHLRVALIDAAEFPRDKTCGDGLGPEGLAVLDRLGLSHVVADAPRLHGIRVVAPSGRSVRGRAPRAGVVVPRLELDARLHAAAVAAGAIPVRHRVRSVDPRADRVVLDGALEAGVVVGADGANSAVARVLRPRPPRDRTGLAMRGYADWPGLDALSIWFLPERWPAYAWAFPLGDGRANVGWGPFDATLVDSRRTLVDGMARWFPDVSVDPATLTAHHLPLSPARTTVGRGRVLLAGDAANLVHPLTGEGIYYALLSGAMAGAAAARFAVGADTTAPAVVLRRAMRARLGRHLRHTDAAAWLLRSSLGIEVAVAAAAADPAVLARLSEFALGTGLLGPGMVWAMTRAWWRGRPFDGVVHAASRR